MSTPEKRGPGRPQKDDDERLQIVHVRLPGAMIDRLDALSEARLDKPDRSKLIREMLAEAIERQQRKGRRP